MNKETQETNTNEQPMTFESAYAHRSGIATRAAKEMLNHLATTTPELEEQQRRIARVLIDVGQLLETTAVADMRNVPAQAAESVFRLVMKHLEATRDAAEVLDDALQLYANMYGQPGLELFETLMHRVTEEGVKLASGLTAHFIRCTPESGGDPALTRWFSGHAGIAAVWNGVIGENPEGAKLVEYMNAYSRQHSSISRLVGVVEVLETVLKGDDVDQIPA